MRALAPRHGPLALLHLDAHSDTWDRYFAGERHSAGTPFRRAVEEGLVDPARSIQLGLRGSLFTAQDVEQSRDLGYAVVTWEDWAETGEAAVIARIVERLGDAPAFLSFDLDVVDPAFAPGVQTPEAGGPSAFEVLRLLRRLPRRASSARTWSRRTRSTTARARSARFSAATVASEILAMIAVRAV